MTNYKRFLTQAFSAIGITLAAFNLQAQTPTENDFYRIQEVVLPSEVQLEVGGMAPMPDGRLAVCTRKGNVYIIENPTEQYVKAPKVTLFASGLHEPLGIAWRYNALVVAQRGGLTRLRDSDGDGSADIYENLATFPISGNYHEYAFGPLYDNEGNAYVTLNVGFFKDWWRGRSEVPLRGWAIRVKPNGEIEPWCTGLRSPAGLGMLNGKDFFYTDNQGDWVGSGAIVHLEKGDFVFNPAGLNWSQMPNSPVKTKAEQVANEGLTFPEAKKRTPGMKLPAVWLPHGVLGGSTSEILPDSTGGKFGPFEGQLFIGDQAMARISRVALEKVKGVYQGAAFAFREGFASGVLRLAWDKSGIMYVGQTDRGWKSSGPKEYGLQRLEYTGKLPFEILNIKAQPDGFLIQFTQAVSKAELSNIENYAVESFTYQHFSKYGSPIVDGKPAQVLFAQAAEDGMSVRLVVEGLRKEYIHQIEVKNIKSASTGWELLHNTGYYTLNQIPDGEKLVYTPVKLAPKPVEKKSTAPASVAKAATPKVEAKPAASKASKPAAHEVVTKNPIKMPASWGGKVDQTITLGTKPGMKFDMNFQEIKAGAKVKWVFANYDDMTHNCLIVNPGRLDAIGAMSLKMGINGPKLNYVPESADVLYHTMIVQPNSSQTIYFVAPSTPGDYGYVCTMPGHAASMRGTLRVYK